MAASKQEGCTVQNIELDKKLEGAGLLNPVVALPPAISLLTLINILQ